MNGSATFQLQKKRTKMAQPKTDQEMLVTLAAKEKYLADLLTRADKDTQGNVRKVLMRVEGSKKRMET